MNGIMFFQGICCILKENLKIATVAMKNLFYTETKAFFKAACTGCKLKRPVGLAKKGLVCRNKAAQGCWCTTYFASSSEVLLRECDGNIRRQLFLGLCK